MKTGDISGKAKLIEKIGDAGARQYAHSMGFEPIYQGKSGQGRGFDHVYKKGKQIIVVEAKGGGSPPRKYKIGLQGTLEYTINVAESTLKSDRATPEAKRAALEVIKAHKEGRLVIQEIRTEHVLGKPTKTTAKTTINLKDAKEKKPWLKCLAVIVLSVVIISLSEHYRSIIKTPKKNYSTFLTMVI